MNNTKIIIVCLFILIIGILIYQYITINKLKKEINSNYLKIYNLFVANKKVIMDSVNNNNKLIDKMLIDIKKMKYDLLNQKPIQYLMTNLLMLNYMSYIILRYKI